MRFIKISLVLFIVAAEAFAGSGSRYSRFGIGDLVITNSARRLGLGELGIALTENKYISNLNPASWSGLNFTRFETGITYSGTSLSDNNNSVFHSNTNLNGMIFGFPVERDYGIAAVVGFVPYSNVDYKTLNVLNDNLVGDYSAEYIGEGGISKIFFGGSYKLPLGFALGINLDYYNGKISNSLNLKVSGQSDFKDPSFTNSRSFNGVGFSAGLLTENLVESLQNSTITNLRFGLTYSSGAKINTDTMYTLSTSIGLIESELGTVKTNIPSRIGFGAAITLNKTFTIVADYITQSFDEYSFNNRKSINLKKYSKYGVGVEYHKGDMRSTSFWEHATLRGGLSLEQSQLTFGETNINQFSVYAGCSLPIGYENSIDLGLQYGIRGTNDNFLLKENIFKFIVSLSIGEIWFLRPER
jgi:hypothetical protein